LISAGSPGRTRTINPAAAGLTPIETGYRVIQQKSFDSPLLDSSLQAKSLGAICTFCTPNQSPWPFEPLGRSGEQMRWIIVLLNSAGKVVRLAAVHTPTAVTLQDVNIKGHK
jgi:hypothetical protein